MIPADLDPLLLPAVVEHAGAGVEVGVGQFESCPLLAQLLLVPVDALLVDDVLDAGPVAVGAVAPLFVDLDDVVQVDNCLHRLALREVILEWRVRSVRLWLQVRRLKPPSQ